MYKRISDEEAIKVIEALENQEEDVLQKVYPTTLRLLVDIRHFLRKLYKETNPKPKNLVTDPSKATKTDIVIGK